MASVTFSSFIKSMHGSIGNIVIYSHKGKSFCRVYAKPHDPKTAAQQRNRQLFAEAMKAWQGLVPDQKHIYNRRAKRLPMTGHNLFISEYMKGRTRGQKEVILSRESIHPVFIRSLSLVYPASCSVATPFLFASGPVSSSCSHFSRSG